MIASCLLASSSPASFIHAACAQTNYFTRNRIIDSGLPLKFTQERTEGTCYMCDIWLNSYWKILSFTVTVRARWVGNAGRLGGVWDASGASLLGTFHDLIWNFGTKLCTFWAPQNNHGKEYCNVFLIFFSSQIAAWGWNRKREGWASSRIPLTSILMLSQNLPFAPKTWRTTKFVHRAELERIFFYDKTTIMKNRWASRDIRNLHLLFRKHFKQH